MKKMIALTMFAGLASAGAQTFTPNLSNVEFGLRGGYEMGLSGGVTVHVRNVSGPLGVRFSADYSNVSDSLNDSANVPLFGNWGTLKSQGAAESGSSTTVGVDLTYTLPSTVAGVDAYLYGGGRYNNFNAVADFTNYGAAGSNAGKTTYSTNQFGLGAGVVGQYALTPNLSLAGDLGVDYYFPSGISTNDGNGNTDTFNQGETGYDDLNALVNQPTTNFKAKIGIVYRF
ncbi:hypothetical protein MF271_04550 [Deinococcus sp. KNUC1210]|uniref:hypothetical protein n=1 Tax=Deinococcus sp. KNUC1210 TaxID=2917691 RepID=UPI001EF0B5F3|nr:hypothetical protein [Deinococcus sp. KNUC1210]ULH15904.1 hypothetical protein MF271_04550 [Deinococcus sp. KNUC1210]